MVQGVTRDEIIDKEPKSNELLQPFIIGDEVRKYRINYNKRYLILLPKGFTNQHKAESEDGWEWFCNTYPVIARQLKPYAEVAQKRLDKGDYWWELRACNYYDAFKKPKIVYPDIAKESRAAFDLHGFYFGNTVYIIPVDDLYLLGILNSKLIFNYFKHIAAVLGDPDKGGRLRWFRQDVMKLPIKKIYANNPSEKSIHDEIINFVSEILVLNKDMAIAEHELDDNRFSLQQRIAMVDREIDQRVYALYGLTEKEIKLVEGEKIV